MQWRVMAWCACGVGVWLDFHDRVRLRLHFHNCVKLRVILVVFCAPAPPQVVLFGSIVHQCQWWCPPFEIFDVVHFNEMTSRKMTSLYPYLYKMWRHGVSVNETPQRLHFRDIILVQVKLFFGWRFIFQQKDERGWGCTRDDPSEVSVTDTLLFVQVTQSYYKTRLPDILGVYYLSKPRSTRYFLSVV